MWLLVAKWKEIPPVCVYKVVDGMPVGSGVRISK